MLFHETTALVIVETNNSIHKTSTDDSMQLIVF